MRLNIKKMKHLMIDTDINNAMLAEITGISYPQISRIKSGGNTTFETAYKIAGVLGANVMDIIDETSIE